MRLGKSRKVGLIRAGIIDEWASRMLLDSKECLGLLGSKGYSWQRLDFE